VAAPVSLLERKMQEVFTNTKLSALKRINDSRVFHVPDFLGWTAAPVPFIYWRNCYTYLLCSLIAGLEKAFIAHVKGKGEKPASFVVTGTQGTGKTVLGVMTALVLRECFGWKVNYFGNSRQFEFGEAAEVGKQVDIFDLCDAQRNLEPRNLHTVYFTSCNESRWHQRAQVANMRINGGHFLFIDVLSEEETVEAACQIANNNGSGKAVDVNKVRGCFKKAGGIARFCFSGEPSDTEKVDTAAKEFLTVENGRTSALKAAIEKLVDMNDAVGSDKKTYPGLVLHCVPQSRSKHCFSLKFATPEIRKKLFKALEKVSNDAIETLLTNLMKRGESRGLAGVVYEEWVNSHVTDTRRGGKLYFAGSSLPFTSPSTSTSGVNCHEFATEDLRAICFKDFDDLTKQLTQLNNSVWKPIYGFSRTRIHEAIDGILLFKHRDKLVLAGIQYTTAAERHPVSEAGVLLLANCAQAVGAETIELWFTQPRQCLEAGASLIVKLQPLKFSNPKVRKIPAEKGKKLGKAAKKVSSFPKTEKEVRTHIKSSNKKGYWHPDAQTVNQFVMVTCLESNPDITKTTTDVQESLRQALNDATTRKSTLDSVDTSNNDGDEELETFLRPWADTVGVATKLLEMEGVDFLNPYLSEFVNEAAEMDVAEVESAAEMDVAEEESAAEMGVAEEESDQIVHEGGH
jgi:hypothetical protein